MLENKYITTIKGEKADVRWDYHTEDWNGKTDFVQVLFGDGSVAMIVVETLKSGKATQAGNVLKKLMGQAEATAEYAGYETPVRPESEAWEEKLIHYTDRPLTPFKQFDGFYLGLDGGDSIMEPDEDGDSCWFLKTSELMHGPDVRILIKDGVTTTDAIRLLNKLTKDMEEDIAILNRQESAPA